MYIETPADCKDQFNALATVELNQRDQKIIAEWAKYKAPADIFEMEVWANYRAMSATGGPTVRLIGICPICGTTHGYSLGGYGPTRQPHCGSPREVVLRVRPGPVPHHVRFALENEPEDAAFWATSLAPREMSHGAKMVALIDSRDGLRKRGPVFREHFRAAVQALVDSGVFDERCAIITADAPERAGPVYRQLVATFIRRQEGRTMRARIAKALTASIRLAGRGEFAA